MYDSIASEPAVELLERILAFREQPPAAPTPSEETGALLSLFPRVGVRDGFVLDYVQDTTDAGVVQPIRPYVRPADDNSVPILDSDPTREDLVDSLYRYLHYELTPEGLFEYAFFVIELWSLRMSRHAAEWLESTPIFSEAAFDQVLTGASKVNDVHRPEFFGPLVRPHEEGGGRTRFMVHTPMGWERIYYLESLIAADGFIEQEAGEIVADIGSGLIF